MNIRPYLDSTYLKTAEQSGLSETENTALAQQFVAEAIAEKFKLVMVRPDQVAQAKKSILAANATVLVGTVIDFPDGTSPIEDKLDQAQKAIEDGADDLDFVCNYRAFQNGEIALVKSEILQGTQLGLSHRKTVKWIIEVAALSDAEIIRLSALIKNVVLSNFEQEQCPSVFVKSSTGFYPTEEGRPNGATLPAIIIMLENACPLPVKAAGGVRTYQEAVDMIRLGVKRIGTSAAKTIAEGETANRDY